MKIQANTTGIEVQETNYSTLVMEKPYGNF